MLIFNFDEDNVDIFAAMNSPSYIITGNVLIRTGVIIGSSDTAIAAMFFDGFAAGSVFHIFNDGRIAGRGGDGGDGEIGVGNFYGGGGGGGGGKDVGVGGAATAPGTAGVNGTATAGGVGGTSDVGAPGPEIQRTAPGDGGPAISHGAFELTITNGSGEIWGGGGGGAAGGFVFLPLDGEDGSAPGDSSSFTSTYFAGFSGKAVAGTGDITWVSGESGPNVKGDIH